MMSAISSPPRDSAAEHRLDQENQLDEGTLFHLANLLDSKDPFVLEDLLDPELSDLDLDRDHPSR
jgi:hypothetical protein